MDSQAQISGPGGLLLETQLPCHTGIFIPLKPRILKGHLGQSLV